MKLLDRKGERKIMNCGEEAEIIEYINNKEIIVKFIKTGEMIKCEYNNFKKGKIKSHFTPTVYGVGIVGTDKIVDVNGKKAISYEIWRSMLQRCYDEKALQRNPTYKNCLVCKEWLYYPNFKSWYDNNYYDVDDEQMCLDKDILFKGNKIYSPETCIFVPHNINKLFTKSNKVRGSLPIGVCWVNRDKVYRAQCNIFDIKSKISKRKNLGNFINIEQSFNTYKKAKEENIKQVADYYKDQIPKKLYDAMYKYEVYIDD